MDWRTLAFGQTFGETFSASLSQACVSVSAHRPHDRTPPHRHANDYICFVLAGAFEQCAHGQRRSFGGGDAVLHLAEDLHEDSFDSAGACCLNIHAAPGPALRISSARPCAGRARALAQLLAAEVVLEEGADPLEANCLLAELLAELGDAAQEERAPAWLPGLIEALHADVGERPSLDELARITNRHPTHLARAFRRATGVSIGAYRRKRRLTELSMRLRRDDAPLASLAYEFGYADQSHMCREFTAFAGVSPAAYRRAR
jgi:AraC family transcriptional regulator